MKILFYITLITLPPRYTWTRKTHTQNLIYLFFYLFQYEFLFLQLNIISFYLKLYFLSIKFLQKKKTHQSNSFNPASNVLVYIKKSFKNSNQNKSLDFSLQIQDFKTLKHPNQGSRFAEMNLRQQNHVTGHILNSRNKNHKKNVINISLITYFLTKKAGSSRLRCFSQAEGCFSWPATCTCRHSILILVSFI